MALRIRGMRDRGELAGGERIMICGPDYTQLMDGTVKTFDYWFEDVIVHTEVRGWDKPSDHVPVEGVFAF